MADAPPVTPTPIQDWVQNTGFKGLRRAAHPGSNMEESVISTNLCLAVGDITRGPLPEDIFLMAECDLDKVHSLGSYPRSSPQRSFSDKLKTERRVRSGDLGNDSPIPDESGPRKPDHAIGFRKLGDAEGIHVVLTVEVKEALSAKGKSARHLSTGGTAQGSSYLLYCNSRCDSRQGLMLAGCGFRRQIVVPGKGGAPAILHVELPDNASLRGCDVEMEHLDRCLAETPELPNVIEYKEVYSEADLAPGTSINRLYRFLLEVVLRAAHLARRGICPGSTEGATKGGTDTSYSLPKEVIEGLFAGSARVKVTPEAYGTATMPTETFQRNAGPKSAQTSSAGQGEDAAAAAKQGEGATSQDDKKGKQKAAAKESDPLRPKKRDGSPDPDGGAGQGSAAPATKRQKTEGAMSLRSSDKGGGQTRGNEDGGGHTRRSAGPARTRHSAKADKARAGAAAAVELRGDSGVHEAVDVTASHPSASTQVEGQASAAKTATQALRTVQEWAVEADNFDHPVPASLEPIAGGSPAATIEERVEPDLAIERQLSAQALADQYAGLAEKYGVKIQGVTSSQMDVLVDELTAERLRQEAE